MTEFSPTDATLVAAFQRVEQALQEIAAVVTAPETVLADLQRVADLSSRAWEAVEAVVRPSIADAVAFYQWRTTARVCCTVAHPAEALAAAFHALHARVLDAHGDLLHLYLLLTGDDCVW